jgi:hypothetical protein
MHSLSIYRVMVYLGHSLQARSCYLRKRKAKTIHVIPLNSSKPDSA